MMLSCAPRRRYSLRAWLALVWLPLAPAWAERPVAWDSLPPLPPSPGQSTQPGLAAPFAGVHGDVLIVGGGANFPVKAPWDGGAKVWWDDVFVLEGLGSAAPRWHEKTFKLPRPLGYGVSFSTPEGVVCVGGNDAQACYREVFLLSWQPAAKKLVTTTLPPLPEPLANMAGAMIGRTLYVAGGQHASKDPAPSTCFWALDLARRNQPAEFRWEALPTWPGPARMLAVAAASPEGSGPFYLFSGRAPTAGQPTQILTDGYAYDPARKTWRTLRNIQGEGRGGGDGWSVMAGVAGVGPSGEVLVVGGDRGEIFLRLEELDREIAARQRAVASAAAGEQAKLNREIDQRLRAKRTLYENHAGFAPEVLAYDPRRDTWSVAGRIAAPMPVTTLAVPWRGGWIIPSGEIRPGVRTPGIARLKIGVAP
jgi:SSS family solute:Na+ symporter